MKVKWNGDFCGNSISDCSMRVPPEVDLFFHLEWNGENFLTIL